MEERFECPSLARMLFGGTASAGGFIIAEGAADGGQRCWALMVCVLVSVELLPVMFILRTAFLSGCPWYLPYSIHELFLRVEVFVMECNLYRFTWLCKTDRLVAPAVSRMGCP